MIPISSVPVATSTWVDAGSAGAANFAGPFDDLPNELMWQHGEVGVDRDGFVFCRRCGASGSDVDDLLTTPCNEPHPLWMDLAS